MSDEEIWQAVIEANREVNGKYRLEQIRKAVTPQGHWIVTEDLRTCSECSMAIYGPIPETLAYSYCPWCGSKMNGEEVI